MERLESREMLSATDWRNLPVSMDTVASGIVQDTAAYDLVGSSAQRSQYGLTGAGYSVAILDTGLDYKNPAFAGRYIGGWDFVNNDADPMDDNGHGTHVAGIIGSADQNYPGIATGVGIVALKVLDSHGDGTYGNVDAALQWVAEHQAQYHIVAVNMSLGDGNYLSSPLDTLDADFQKLEAEGVFVAAASGNSYFGYYSKPGMAFPAVDSLVVSVGAVWAADYGGVSWVNGASDHSTAADQITSFTQRDDRLSILAPGAYVTSTYLADSFATLAGTSMACPMIVGASVLIHQALDEAGKSADQSSILHVMQETGVSVVDSDHGQDNVTHTGLEFKRLDVLAAVASVIPYRTPNEKYVANIYEHVLGRQPDKDGLAHWSTALDGGTSRSVVAAAIWDSREHLASEVKADYRKFFDRQPGDGEVSYWVGRLQTGMGELEIEREFLASKEFSGTEHDDQHFVGSLYSTLLDRTAEHSAVDSWSKYLNQGLPRGIVTDAVFDSQEHYADIAGELYSSLLGRGASKSDLAWWAGQFKSGATLESVACEFLASNEFYGSSAA